MNGRIQLKVFKERYSGFLPFSFRQPAIKANLSQVYRENVSEGDLLLIIGQQELILFPKIAVSKTETMRHLYGSQHMGSWLLKISIIAGWIAQPAPADVRKHGWRSIEFRIEFTVSLKTSPYLGIFFQVRQGSTRSSWWRLGLIEVRPFNHKSYWAQVDRLHIKIDT